MRLVDVLRSSGPNGVIARLSSDFVVLVRKFNPETGAAVLVIVDDNQIGNWEPSKEDEQATDWFVVAQSPYNGSWTKKARD